MLAIRGHRDVRHGLEKLRHFACPQVNRIKCAAALEFRGKSFAQKQNSSAVACYAVGLRQYLDGAQRLKCPWIEYLDAACAVRSKSHRPFLGLDDKGWQDTQNC